MMRPNIYHVQQSLAVCTAAMKSSKAWAKNPGSFNQLLHALTVTAENLSEGRPSVEDPPESAAYGKVGSAEISMAFNILCEVAQRNGSPFFEYPEGAAGELRQIALHFHALNFPFDKYADGSELAGVTIRARSPKSSQDPEAGRFSLLPLWPMDPVEANPDGDEPIVVSDGNCGHTRYGERVKASECAVCGPSWQKQYRESVERRRAWERRRDERVAREGQIKTDAELTSAGAPARALWRP